MVPDAFSGPPPSLLLTPRGRKGQGPTGAASAVTLGVTGDRWASGQQMWESAWFSPFPRSRSCAGDAPTAGASTARVPFHADSFQ